MAKEKVKLNLLEAGKTKSAALPRANRFDFKWKII
jgi:hypothetical protein